MFAPRKGPAHPITMTLSEPDGDHIGTTGFAGKGAHAVRTWNEQGLGCSGVQDQNLLKATAGRVQYKHPSYATW